MAEAQMLKDEQRFLEAASILEELAVQRGTDGDLFAQAAVVVSSQADREQGGEKARLLHKRARALAEKAEQLGTSNPLTPMILKSVRPDGTLVDGGPVQFSKREEVDRLMKEGEEAFRVGQYEKAGRCYQKALALEPGNFTAALWSGDAYLAAKDPLQAILWYRKAINLSPENETGHRYLGDALSRLGETAAARDEWIEALLCEPYQRLTRQHFTSNDLKYAEVRGHRIPRFSQGLFTIDSAKKEIQLDSKASLIGGAYSLACAAWRMGSFAGTFPNETKPRRSLPEEMAGLEVLIELVEAPPGKDDKPGLEEEKAAWKEIVADLKELRREGLLEAYVLLDRPDEGLAKDYAPYRAEHREELRRYVRRYWCGLD